MSSPLPLRMECFHCGGTEHVLQPESNPPEWRCAACGSQTVRFVTRQTNEDCTCFEDAPDPQCVVHNP